MLIIPNVTTDPGQIRPFLEAVTEPGKPFEIRVLGPRPDGPSNLGPQIQNGWFNDIDAAIGAVQGITGEDAAGVYVTLNELAPAMDARVTNRLSVSHGATGDADVAAYRHFYIDIDPIRPSDCNATEDEHAAAYQRAQHIYSYLRDELSWPDPVWAGSTGSGYVLLYRVNLQPDQRSLIDAALKALAWSFDDDQVKIDTAVGNPSRLVRVAGTVNAKAVTPSLDRPWRLATGKTLGHGEVVTEAMLASLGAQSPRPANPSSSKRGESSSLRVGIPYDISQLLKLNAVGYRVKEQSYGTVYALNRCLTSDDHTDGAAIIQLSNGAVTYTCRHDRCAGLGWNDVKHALGLESRNDGAPDANGATSAPPSDEDWDDPIPLFPKHGPKFPIAALPGVLGRYVEAVATETQTSIDLAAVVALGSISAAVGGKFKIFKPFKEPVHIQTLAVAEPGMRKSAVFEQVTRPISTWEREQWPEDDVRILEWTSKKRVLEKDLTSAENDVRKPSIGDEKEDRDLIRKAAVRELATHDAARPYRTRVMADDITPEATGTHLHQQGGAFAVMSAESAFLSNIAGRYGDSPNFDVMLKGHAGEGGGVDRVVRDHEDVPRACLTLCLTIQPHVVSALGRTPGFVDRGGAARLLPAIVPDNRGYEDLDAPHVPPALEEEWNALIRHLLFYGKDKDPQSDDTSRPSTVSPEANPKVDNTPRPLTLSAEALAIFRQFRADHRLRMREGGSLSNIASWGSKMPGAVLRIAGLQHVSLHDRPESQQIAAPIMTSAIVIGEYFAEHAQIMHRMMSASSAENDATAILEVLQRLGPVTTRRDLHQAVRGQANFAQSKDLSPALALLEEYGYIQTRHGLPGQTKGRKSQVIYLNPRKNILKILKMPVRVDGEQHSEDFEDDGAHLEGPPMHSERQRVGFFNPGSVAAMAQRPELTMVHRQEGKVEINTYAN